MNGAVGPKYTHRAKPNINAELKAYGITASPQKGRTKPGPGEYNFTPDAPFKKLSYSMSGPSTTVVKGTES